MRNILKWTLWGLFALLVLPVVIYLAWLTGNLRDDEVAPEIVAILNEPPEPSLSPAENAFYGFIGIQSPEDTEPDAWGQTWVNQAREINTARAQGLKVREAPSIANKLRPRALTDTQIPCNDIAGCLERVAANPEATRKALEAETMQLQRFDALLNRAYREPDMGPLDFRSPFPPYSGSASFRLAESRIALWLAEGKHLEAIEQLRKESHFIHAMLEGSRTLISKMLATQLLRRRHQLIEQLIALHPKVARIHAAKISEALPELSTQASSMREVLETELVWSFNSLNHVAISGLEPLLDDQPGGDSPRLDLQLMEFLVAPFFKPIATSNETSRWYLAWIRVDNARREGAPQYRHQLAQLKKSIQEQTKTPHTRIPSYRNPIGKIITQIGSPDLSTYFFRRDNLIADRLLLQHALDVISGKMAFNPNPTALHQADLLHPFTGKPPVWDETRRELRFEPPDDLEVSGRHAPSAVRLPVAP